MRVMRRSAAWNAALALVVLAAACSSGDGGALDLSDYAYPVQQIEEIDDRSHFPTGQTYDGYNSNPPTSGPHADTFAPAGVSELAVAKGSAPGPMGGTESNGPKVRRFSTRSWKGGLKD